MEEKILDNSKDRIMYLDVLRKSACFFVILLHTISKTLINANINTTWIVSLILFFISKACIPLFLMITGSVTFKKNYGIKKCLKKALKAFLVLIIFSLLTYIVIYRNDLSTLMNIKYFAKCIMTNGIAVPFWYMYLYICLLLLMPFLQKITKSINKTECKYLLTLTVLVPALYMLIVNYIPQLEITKDFLIIHTTTYIGMCFLGYYINEYCDIKKSKTIIAYILLTLSIIVPTLLTYFTYKSENIFIGSSKALLIFNIIFSASFFYLIKRRTEKIKNKKILKIASYISKYTFFIYLISNVLMIITTHYYHSLVNYINPLICVIIESFVIYIVGLLLGIILEKLHLDKIYKL